MKSSKFGLYLNVKENKLVRVNSPYWIPSGPDWVHLTTDPNLTLLKARDLAKEKKLVKEPEKIVWGDLPPAKE